MLELVSISRRERHGQVAAVEEGQVLFDPVLEDFESFSVESVM